MTIRFEFRTTRKTKGVEMVPLHISVSDGRAFRQRQVTNIMVNPEHWDVKAGDLKKRYVINGAVEYIPTKTIKENVRTVVVPLNTIAQEIVDRYADLPGDQLLPFESSERYNDNIKIIFEKAGVTKLDTVTRTEVKVPINEIASSHMARRTFIGNIYKLVKDPNLVSALTGHVEGSRAFTRYRTIDIDMKKDLVKILEGKQ